MASIRNNFQVDRRLPEQLLASQAAIEKPDQASRRGLLEGFSKLLSDLIEVSKNFGFDFLHEEVVKNCESHRRSPKKSYLTFRTFKKYSSRDIIPYLAYI